MNYANMIEEKNLKKTFIIATLCSTLVGTFTSSIGLWDRVQDKRRQSKRDTKQEEAIKKLQERADKAEKERDEARRGGPQHSRPRRNDDYYYSDDGDEVGDSFQRSGALIQRQFDEGYGRLGNRFAIGDTITENRLQRHIIALQQTVIQVLQDALANDRHLTRADMAKLVAASDAARLGSVEALREQQQRLALNYDLDPHTAPPRSSVSSSTSRYAALENTSPQRALIAAPKRSSTIIVQEDIVPTTNTLFCPYSTHLQNNPHTPLSPTSFKTAFPCPECTTPLPISATDIWIIGKTAPLSSSPHHQDVLETREFRLGPRFVVKCHTRDGEFACVLCARFRERDAICRSIDALVNHVGRFHGVGELEMDVDLREVAVRKGSVVSVGREREWDEGRRGSVVRDEYR